MTKLEIALLTGGRSGERDRSLLSGVTVDTELRAMGHSTTIFDVSDASFLNQVRRFDLAFLAIAGEYGEDGRLQGCLDTLGVAYTGSGVFASAAGMDKMKFKAIARSEGIPVLPDVLISPTESVDFTLRRIETLLKYPVLLKPLSDGCSNNITVCRNLNQLRLEIERIHSLHAKPFMAEEFLEKSTSLTVGVIEVEGKTRALQPLEIESPGDFYDAQTKRTSNAATYHCPARISPDTVAYAQALATKSHKLLGCRSHSRTDFVLRGSELFVLEINTLPGLSKTGNLATMAKVDNISYRNLLQIIIDNALESRCELQNVDKYRWNADSTV